MLIRILDHLFQQELDDGIPRTVLSLLTPYLFTAHLFACGYIDCYYKLNLYPTLWIHLFPTSFLYRYLRHRYLRRHHLPGPYGNGTIDKEKY